MRNIITRRSVVKQMRQLAKLRNQLREFNALREDVITTMTVLKEGEATFDAVMDAYGQVMKASLELAQRSKDRK